MARCWCPCGSTSRARSGSGSPTWTRASPPTPARRSRSAVARSRVCSSSPRATTARAGDPFTLNVSVTNDAGSVIQEINSLVTLTVLNATTRAPGQGGLLPAQIQLLQGQRSVSATYTFAEPIVIVANDDAGNAPATSNAIDITPGPPAAVQLSSTPPWVGGNKSARLDARVVDAYGNGVPAAPLSFALISG